MLNTHFHDKIAVISVSPKIFGYLGYRDTPLFPRLELDEVNINAAAGKYNKYGKAELSFPTLGLLLPELIQT